MTILNISVAQVVQGYLYTVLVDEEGSQVTATFVLSLPLPKNENAMQGYRAAFLARLGNEVKRLTRKQAQEQTEAERLETLKTYLMSEPVNGNPNGV